MVKGFVIGFLFGFVLHRAGLVRYSRIIGALLLRDLKVLKFMFTGIAVALLGYGLSGLLGLELIPRINPYLGPAHLLGGILFGLGMGLSGL
jgi:hypothetical protein